MPVLHRVAGKDASKQFWKYHNESILKKYQKQLQVGSLDSKAAPPTPPATPTAGKEIVKPSSEHGVVAPQPGPAAEEVVEALDPYGDLVPYADPSWYQSVSLNPLLYHNMCLPILTRQTPSTTLPTLTNPTPISAPKSDNGSKKTSCQTSRNGKRVRRFPTASTKPWVSGDILLV